MKVEDLKIMSYLLEEKGMVKLERRNGSGGPDSWAIATGGFCLNKNGDFEYEMLPSNRPKTFLERCRWDDPEEALKVWEKHVLNHDPERKYAGEYMQGVIDRPLGANDSTGEE